MIALHLMVEFNLTYPITSESVLWIRVASWPIIHSPLSYLWVSVREGREERARAVVYGTIHEGRPQNIWGFEPLLPLVHIW